MARKKFSLLLLLLLAGLLVSSPTQPAAADSTQLITDFESGQPTDWFNYSGGGATVTTTFPTVSDADPLAQPGQVGDNTFVETTFDASAGFAGFGQDFSVSGGSQDWSSFTAVSFDLYGTNSGQSIQFEIMDNRSDPSSDTAERFDTIVVDDFSGWQHLTIPFTNFSRATDFQPGGAPDDGLTLTEMWGLAIILDGANGTLRFDNIGLERAIVDDFESGLPSGVDGDGNNIGFYTFQDPNSTVSFSATDTPPAPVPGTASGNHVLQIDSNVNGSNGFAGVTHAFENETVDTWTPQDWSRFSGISFWLYGNNTGSILFIDVQDNRAPGTTGDTAERYSIDIIDDFSGWQFFEIPFDSLTRKEIGNGAPNDGLNLTEVHGWAFGVFDAGQPFSNYIDDVALYGVADVPELAVGFAANNFNIPEGSSGQIRVSLNRPLGEADPAQVSVDYSVETIVAEAGVDYVQPAAGTLIFTNGDSAEQTFTIETLDDDKYEGTERLVLRLSNPVDVAPGFIMQAAASIVDDETFDPLLLDDFELGAYLWDSSDDLTLSTIKIAPSETVLQAAPIAGPSLQAQVEEALTALNALLPGSDAKTTTHLEKAIDYLSNALDADNWLNSYYLTNPVGRSVFSNLKRATLELSKIAPNASEATAVSLIISQLTEASGNLAQIALTQAVVNNGRPANISIAERQIARGDSELELGNPEIAINWYGNAWLNSQRALVGATLAAPTFGRDFALGQDWQLTEGIAFNYYGQGSGETITLELLDNRAPDPGPSGWSMVWSDEFNDPAGTPPNPENWGYEIGDGTVNGIPGWGNAELQYYTDEPANAATDGSGNLVISVKDDDDSLTCYYGPCEYTSARLISWHKAEFAYGRIESRILVPPGEDGLWPAFWSLGTDINVVDWPQTGEIDIMEYVSRIPDEVFGTIHGPGYSGGSAYGNTYNFPGGVSTDYHTFTIEWQPDLIEWYVDDILFHSATPADVAPNEWVFNDPVFLILNMAIGGNFGGPVSDEVTFPQDMVVDYVRVYQGPDTAERFEAAFVDDFTGWQEVFVPYSAFSRSAEQPAGATDDGLNLNSVWGYGFKLPAGGTVASAMIDQVRLVTPTEVTVSNTNDNGPGSLREAVALVAQDGTVLFDPALAGSTIALTGGPLVANKSVTIDAEAAPGITLSGGGVDRVLIVEAPGDVTMRHLTLADGYGWQLAGGVLNNSTLTLDHVTVTNNTMATNAGDFWQGGGGIYNGENASLTLIDSSVTNNTAAWSGGGVYSFFNTNTTVIRSTISGNISSDVGGGFRFLGNGEIVNSTISGNESIGWHGGALFVTDGVVNLTNVTIANNISPAGGPADVFVGTFTDASATLTLTNTIVDSAGENCFFAPFGSGVVTLTADHNNVFTDATCFAGATDQVVADAGVDALADNGGPTLTHALLAGSAAIDAADTAVCPATDQRGNARDATCDVGAYEFMP